MALKRVGLTGGVAAGKSTVAEKLRARGLVVLDLDAIGRDITDRRPEVGPHLAALAGAAILKDGKVDRTALRAALFRDPDLRRRVEGLLHPLIWEEFERESRRAEARGHGLVICEAALIVEAGLQDRLDGVIVVLAPEATRVARLRARDGIDEELARKILAAQVDDAARRRAATYLIRNDGTPEGLDAQVETILDDFRRKGWL